MAQSALGLAREELAGEMLAGRRGTRARDELRRMLAPPPRVVGLGRAPGVGLLRKLLPCVRPQRLAPRQLALEPSADLFLTTFRRMPTANAEG